jgi:uncharacterized protein YuzE
MSVTTIAGISFDEHEYDERADVLYLSVGPPQKAFKTIATPEGHAVDYDESGAMIGMVLVNVRFLLDRDGAITVTPPPARSSASGEHQACADCRLKTSLHSNRIAESSKRVIHTSSRSSADRSSAPSRTTRHARLD